MRADGERAALVADRLRIAPRGWRPELWPVASTSSCDAVAKPSAVRVVRTLMVSPAQEADHPGAVVPLVSAEERLLERGGQRAVSSWSGMPASHAVAPARRRAASAAVDDQRSPSSTCCRGQPGALERARAGLVGAGRAHEHAHRRR